MNAGLAGQVFLGQLQFLPPDIDRETEPLTDVGLMPLFHSGDSSRIRPSLHRQKVTLRPAELDASQAKPRQWTSSAVRIR